MSEIGQALPGYYGRALRAALLSGAVLLGCGQAARAQFAFEGDILPPRVVAWRLADHGYSRLSRPRFDGRVYVVEAMSPTGVPVRLFVDPGVGAIVGRQRLGPPETYARLEPPRPGFGWTEEDVRPRPALRPLPDEAPAPSPRPVRRPGAEAARPDLDPRGVGTPYGINPDAAARTEAPRAEPPKRVARTRQPDLKPALRTAPEAPAPQIPPAQADRAPETKSEPSAIAGDKAAPDASTHRPAAAEARAEAAKPAAQDWRDPPPDKRPVRVIGGATIVPGTAAKEGEATP